MTGDDGRALTGFRLRALLPSDDEDLAGLFDDDQTRLWNPCPATGFIAWRLTNSAAADDFRTWAVSGADDRLAGVVSLFSIDGGTGTAEIGFRTVPGFRGRGVAQAGVRLATRFARDECGISRILLYHAVGNEASCAVARACGYELDEVLASNHEYGDGQLHDEHRHAHTALPNQ